MASKDGATLKQSGYILFAFDPAPHLTTSRAPGSVSALKQTLKSTGPINDLLQYETKNLEGSPEIIKPVTSRIVQLVVGEAVQLRYQSKLTRTSGPTEIVVFLQYEFLKNTDLYTFTFETYPDQADKYIPIYEEIINSFKFLK